MMMAGWESPEAVEAAIIDAVQTAIAPSVSESSLTKSVTTTDMV